MQINYLEALLNVILASFGGIVKRLSEIEKRPNAKASFSYYVVGSIISMFVGIVVYFLCKNFDISQFLTAGLTSLSGYMGAPALDLLSRLVESRVEREVKSDRGGD